MPEYSSCFMCVCVCVFFCVSGSMCMPAYERVCACTCLHLCVCVCVSLAQISCEGLLIGLSARVQIPEQGILGQPQDSLHYQSTTKHLQLLHSQTGAVCECVWTCVIVSIHVCV
jgi:hypothetical protein